MKLNPRIIIVIASFLLAANCIFIIRGICAGETPWGGILGVISMLCLIAAAWMSRGDDE